MAWCDTGKRLLTPNSAICVYISNIFVVLTLILCVVSISHPIREQTETHLLHCLPLYRHSKNLAGQYT
jgi:hypothetical protein